MEVILDKFNIEVEEGDIIIFTRYGDGEMEIGRVIGRTSKFFRLSNIDDNLKFYACGARVAIDADILVYQKGDKKLQLN